MTPTVPLTPQTVPLQRIGRDVLPLGMLVLILALQFLVSKSAIALARPFWFDEMITYRIASDPSLGHSFSALADGVDFNPPAVHLLSRAALSVSPFSAETTLRLIPLLAMWSALIGLYFVLRPTYSAAVTLAVVLATEANALVAYQMFEARFYALWSAAIVWYCFFLQRSTQRDKTWPVVGLAFTSVLVCTTHYFGIISLVLATLGHFAAQGAAVAPRRAGWLAMLAGPVVLAACMPLYLGQRSALTVPTWIEPLSMPQVTRIIDDVFPTRVLIAIAGVWWLGQLLPARSDKTGPGLPADRIRAVAGLSALMLMPVCLIVFSWLVQPVMVSRYAIVAVFGAAPLLALLLSQSWRRVVFVAAPYFMFASLAVLNTNVQLARHTMAEQKSLLSALERCSGAAPIVFEDPHDIFPATHYESNESGRFFFLDFETDELPKARPYHIVNRDVVRRHVQHYPVVALLPHQEIRKLDQVFVVLGQGKRVPGPEFDRFQKKLVAGRVWELKAPADK